MGCLLKGGGGLHSRLVVGAVVLASGRGDTVGARPTCLLELGGVALIRRLLIALSGAGVDEVVVVLGHHAELIEPALQDFPITVVRNPDPDDDAHEGQASSLRVGLAALTGKLDAVLVTPADQPMINAQDLTQLIGAYKKRPDGSAIVVPLVDGQAGNPVIFSAEMREQILTGTAIVSRREWREGHADRVNDFVTPNKRYRVTIGDPDDIARFEASTGHRLAWPASLRLTVDAA
jgi:molybdenum cofactor cytidylyltransferase